LISYKRWSILFLLILTSGCAHILHFPSYKPFSEKEINYLISQLKEQQENISSFQGIGRLRYKDDNKESGLDLFIVGRRPHRVRLEVTHPWGKPLFHIVVDGKNISVLSPTDNKFFRGPLTSSNIRRFVNFDLEPDLVWEIFAGGIPILPYNKADSLKAREIILYDMQNEVVEVISFSYEDLLPRSVSFPKKGFSVILSKFKEDGSGGYPLNVEIVNRDKNRSLDIRYKSLKFNRIVPEEVFQLNPPPNFKIIQLGHNGN
jgi:outer membrane lipoprotein-sorting protein